MRERRFLAVVAAMVLVFVVGLGLGRATSSGDVDAPVQMARPDRYVAERNEERTVENPAGARGGFPRTEEGAVAAAVRYATLLDGPALLDDEARTAAIRDVAATGAEAELDDALGRVAEIIVMGLGLTPELIADPGFVWRPVPVGWQIRRYDPDESVVALWGTGVLVAEGRQLQQPGWRTVEVELRWESEDWRLVAMRSEEGPTPPLAGADGARAVGEQIAEFGEFAYWPAPRGG